MKKDTQKEQPTVPACNHCNCTKWIVSTTTQKILDAETGESEQDAYIRKEYRCSNCNGKAREREKFRLEALDQNGPVKAA